MRLGVIKASKYETTFYNMAIFNKDEDLIIFPYEEFLSDYDEITANLRIMSKVLKEVLANPPDDPRREFEILEHYLNKAREEFDPLLKFDTQTTLESFAKSIEKIKKRRYIDNKGDLQCLIGLNGR